MICDDCKHRLRLTGDRVFCKVTGEILLYVDGNCKNFEEYGGD